MVKSKIYHSSGEKTGGGKRSAIPSGGLSSIYLFVLDDRAARLVRTTTDLFLGLRKENGTGGLSYLCLIPFSNPFFRTNLECKQGRKGLKSPYLIQQKKPYLSSDRDSCRQETGGPKMDYLLESN